MDVWLTDMYNIHLKLKKSHEKLWADERQTREQQLHTNNLAPSLIQCETRDFWTTSLLGHLKNNNIKSLLCVTFFFCTY